jgi:hypothetical protein
MCILRPYSTSNEGIWKQKKSNSMQGIKSATFDISNLGMYFALPSFLLFLNDVL